MRGQAQSTQGFTLVEVLVVLALITLLSYVALIGYSKQRTQATLRAAAEDIQFQLEGARADALAGKNGEAQGIKFATDSYIRFGGETYSSSDSSNQTKSIDEQLLISTTLSGDETIVFDRLTGATGGTATVTVALRDDLTKFRQLVIGPRGDINLLEP